MFFYLPVIFKKLRKKELIFYKFKKFFLIFFFYLIKTILLTIYIFFKQLKGTFLTMIANIHIDSGAYI